MKSVSVLSVVSAYTRLMCTLLDYAETRPESEQCAIFRMLELEATNLKAIKQMYCSLPTSEHGCICEENIGE